MLNLGYVRAVDSRMVPTHVAGASVELFEIVFSTKQRFRAVSIFRVSFGSYLNRFSAELSTLTSVASSRKS